ncbi:hypothetical protein BSPWISOX_171 [uncultured Gammaproteobacteria bacterium]|nr:hypothetical protein BSPWISOX_171 [uncultured Gammaproteobacteria bacterium]VVM27710.1 hypothetical protein BSPWISOXPB_6713 [uncultured Gammaproteobacteria bacterium]
MKAPANADQSISDQREGGGYNTIAGRTRIIFSISDQREGGGYNLTD